MTIPDVSAPRPHSSKAQFAYSLAGAAAGLAANAASGFMVAKLLGPVGRGNLAGIMNWATIGGYLATLGLAESIVYFSARRPAFASRYFVTSWFLTLPASGLICGALFLCMPFLLGAQDASVTTAARWYLLSVPVTAFYLIADKPLRGIGDFAAWAKFKVVEPVTWLCVVAVMSVIGEGDPAIIASAFTAVRLLLLPPVALMAIRRAGRSYRPVLSTLRPMIRFAIPALASSTPLLLNGRLDQLLMAAVLPARDLGLYVVSVAWASLSTVVPLSFGNVLFPRLAQLHDHTERQRHLLGIGCRIGLFLSITGSLVLAGVTPLLLPTAFGDEFSSAVPFAILLLVASVFSGWNWVLEEAARGLGRPRFPLVAELSGLAVTGTVLGLFLSRYGLFAACIASMVGYATVSVVMVVQLSRGVAISPYRLMRPVGTDFAAIRRAVSGAYS